MYEYLAFFYPKGVRERMFEQFNYFSLKVRKEFVVGAILFFTVMLTLSFSLQFSRIIFPGLSDFFGLLLLFIISCTLVQVLIYSIISLVATTRGKFIESILPDALQLISANLRSGMTIDRALIAASRPEFGSFNDQFIIVGKEITTGTKVSDALMNMTRRVKSDMFLKAVQLIVTGMASGGELSRLLSEVAENLVHQRTLEQKVKTSVSTYLIFIMAAVGFAAPVMYGLSTTIVDMIVNTFSSLDIPPNSNMPFSIEMSDETARELPGFVRMYTRTSLITLGIMASFLLGLIKKGNAKYGLMYIPFIVALGLSIYYGVAWLSSLVFSAVI
ncbi:MAG: type II secretion system F family protein [Candidatus Woesearchaeota archaeon]